MTREKLNRIKRQIEACKRNANNLRASDLIAIATALGRKRVKRGKEPTYESTLIKINALTIPYHSGELRPGTARSILKQLEVDVFWIEDKLDREKASNIHEESKLIH